MSQSLLSFIQSIVREREPYITGCERYGDSDFVLDTYRGEETR
ncbi:hypothetical protein BMWSH_4758 [Priestia megaterium WSH-002]|uniref:Uncharacterized protein n=1 Tax=Priestia megaterium (strain WSH-002) TaxID=1006007 RepID=A0A8D3X3E0_PRIMW|nr:hypothetical protein BMWSH_4758 [Priestia megaterium WSH-002]